MCQRQVNGRENPMKTYCIFAITAFLAVVFWLFPEARPSLYPVSLWTVLILGALMGAVYLGLFWLVLRVGRHAIKGR
jgi:hypothetical protein